MKLNYSKKVKILGTQQTLKENILNFIIYMKHTNSINDYSECELCYNDENQLQCTEISDFLKEKGITIKGRRILKNRLCLKFKAYNLIAYCQILPEPEELTKIHSWSALFLDDKILIQRLL